MLNILAAHREIITIEPPQLSFPEKITRLVTHQSSLRPGKLVCNDKMWWNGIELVSQRSKLGLLGKISLYKIIYEVEISIIRRNYSINRENLGWIRISTTSSSARFTKIYAEIASTNICIYRYFIS